KTSDSGVRRSANVLIHSKDNVPPPQVKTAAITKVFERIVGFFSGDSMFELPLGQQKVDQYSKEVFLSAALARELDISTIPQPIIVRIPKPTSMARDSVLGRKSIDDSTVKLELVGVPLHPDDPRAGF